MEAKSSGGVMGFCLARTETALEGGRGERERTIDEPYTVFFMVSVATTTLLSALMYLEDRQKMRTQGVRSQVEPTLVRCRPPAARIPSFQ